jgi:hypothetical protein
MRVEELQTPVLTADVGAVECNIAAMQAVRTGPKPASAIGCPGLRASASN